MLVPAPVLIQPSYVLSTADKTMVSTTTPLLPQEVAAGERPRSCQTVEVEPTKTQTDAKLTAYTTAPEHHD